MRILLDESVPRKFGRLLVGHTVQTVPKMGWAHKKNGELLRLAESNFDVFLVVDRGLVHQQNLSGIKIAIVQLIARSNRLESLQPLVPQVLDVLKTIRPGDIIEIR